MRWIFIILIFPWSFAQAQVIDDFSDGNFTVNPEWIGATDRFRVEPASGMLQLYAPAADGEAWLFTRSESMENAVWQFRIRMGFNPSSSNYAQVYLATQSSDYPVLGNAFYLVLGTTADNISLWERKMGVSRRLIEGQAGRLNLNNVDARVRVTRKKGGLFILEVNMGEGWIEEGRFQNSLGMEASWFGLSCHYTSTRSTLFYFDDIMVSGEAYKDTIPPAVTHFEVLNRYSLLLRFSKSVNKLQLSPNCFLFNQSTILPELLMVPGDEYAVKLQIKDGLPNLSGGALQISGLTDTDSNIMPDAEFSYTYQPAVLSLKEMVDKRNIRLCFSRPINHTNITTENIKWLHAGPTIKTISSAGPDCFNLLLNDDFPNGETLQFLINRIVSVNGDTIDKGPYDLFFYLPGRFDVVISEVMADPSPVVMLPDSEYIELYNRSQYPIQMNGWKISVGTRETVLGNYLLFPDDYLLLVPSTQTGEWSFVPNRLALTSWPLLPNTGEDIVLRDKFGNVITSLRYNPGMGASGFKQEGGWSLEIKDPDNLSGDWENWSFSNHESGGTPGRSNSIATSFADTRAPEITGYYVRSKNCMVVEFSEPMLMTGCMDLFQPAVKPTILNIASCKAEEVFLKETEVCFQSDLPEKTVFTLIFNNLPSDLAGNRLTGYNDLHFGWPEKPDAGDLVINELLYDPPTNGSDYLELYNRSDKILDLSEIYVARATADGNPEKLVRLSQTKRLFLPEKYLAFTPDRIWLLNNYVVEDNRAIIHLSELPNYLTKEGTIFVTDVSGQPFDRFDYHESMHFSLLASKKGVALERIDVNAPTQSKSNWHSASASSGYGTPGMRNSQMVVAETVPYTDFISVEPEVFFPNQDGMNDLLMIRYSFLEPGNTCSVTIFNREGKPVRHLINNQMVGTVGFFTWDGLNDQGGRCATGIYVIWVRSFNLSGKVSETRKIAVLGSGRP